MENTVSWIKKGYTKFSIIRDIKFNKIVGFGQISFDQFWNLNETTSTDDIKIYLTRIYLDPQYFGLGLGLKLLKNLEEFVLEKNRKSYYLHVHKENKIGWSFYKKNGFKLTNESDLNDETMLEVELVKSLTS